jgi:hydroxycarboxylate dehydrogenase B
MADHLIPTAALHRWVVELWLAAGSGAREASLTADHLVAANLAGHDSHGVGMLPRYVQSFMNDELKLNQKIELVADSGSLVTIDGKRGMGQSVTYQAMDLAIARAKANGVCVMGLKNAHHLGRVGHWAEQAVAEGLISIHFTNAVAKPAMVAPHGGAEGRFLTNPFTVGIPKANGHGEHLVLDFATSAIAHGKVRVAYNKKVPVPEGCLIDVNGVATNDPAVMFERAAGRSSQGTGALVAAAGHKGYALAMVCELLGAALTGGETAQPEHLTMTYGIWNNMLALVFDPARLGTSGYFDKEVASFVRWVKSAPLRPGFDAILMPGDPERAARKARAKLVPIDSGTLAQLDQAAETIHTAKGHSPGPLSALQAA